MPHYLLSSTGFGSGPECTEINKDFYLRDLDADKPIHTIFSPSFFLLLCLHVHIELFHFKGIGKERDEYLVIRTMMCICTAAVRTYGHKSVGCDCCLLSHLVAFLERGQFVWKLVEYRVFLNLQTATRNADSGEKPR